MAVLRIIQALVAVMFLAALALLALISFGQDAGSQAAAAEQAPERPRVSQHELTTALEEELLAERNGEGLSFFENLILTATGRAMTAVENAEAEMVLDVATLNGTHVVKIDQVVHLAQLLPEGMTSPPDAPRDLFARAQMPRYLRETECGPMLATFATACQVRDVRFTPQEGNTYRVRANIAFVAEDGPGLIPEGAQLKTTNEWVEVYNGTLDGRDQDELAKLRTLGYEFVVEQCAAFRDTYGNCVVEQITLRLDPVAGENPGVRAMMRTELTVIEAQPGG